jgi:3-phenylpropionate/trans-cinnamate dioxygenase ferredoxin component
MEDFEAVMRTPDLGPGAVTEVEVQGRTVALGNVGQQYFALDAQCPEDGTNLAVHGLLEGDFLVCPRDHAAFDVRTGHRRDHDSALRRYAVRIEGNEIMVGPPVTD